MLTKYFENLRKNIIKKGTAPKAATKKSVAKTKKSDKSKSSKKVNEEIDSKKFKEQLEKIIPTGLTINNARPISVTGFSPEGADLIIYKNYCHDLLELFDGAVPHELVYGTIHFVNTLNKKSMGDVFNKVATVKKINYFSEDTENVQQLTIPSFIIVSQSEYDMANLKNEITNYYISNNIENNHEMDILMIMNHGVVVKNWREKRSFIALETGKDTLMWFFVLLSEYLEVSRGDTLDLRKYIKSNIVYPEY